jgi:hypothetical protein
MDSASWGKFLQPAFSFIYCYLRQFWRCFLQFALHFRDRIAIQPNAGRILSVIAARLVDPIVHCRRIIHRRHDHGKNLAERPDQACAKSCILQVYGVLATHNR